MGHLKCANFGLDAAACSSKNKLMFSYGIPNAVGILQSCVFRAIDVLFCKVGQSKTGVVLTGYNRPGQYSRSGQFRSIEKLSGRFEFFSGHLKIGDVVLFFPLMEVIKM